MSTLFSFFKKTPKTKDTGLRGTLEGRLYVDKKVFYKRPEVIEAIRKLKESVVIKDQIEANRI
jgi:hypothetical protein